MAGGGPRVAHLLVSAAWGGAEQVAETLRSEAERSGWSASLVLPFARAEGWSSGAPAVVPWRRWAMAQRLDADVVHAHLPWPDRLGPALVAARGSALVVTFHFLPEVGRWPNDRFFGLPSTAMLRAAGALRRRVRWVALSRADAAVLRGMLRAPVAVVRNAPPPVTRAPTPVAWPDGALRLLSVGRLEWQKGYDRMLDALAHPSLRDLPWHWNLLGDGADRETLAERARAHGVAHRVSFLGARPAIDGLSSASLLLAPSRREGMPLVPLEAAEAGVPVLASPIAPHRELYAGIPDALLPDDEARWPDALARALGDAALRARVLLAQRGVLGDNPRRATWAAYEALYRELQAR